MSNPYLEAAPPDRDPWWRYALTTFLLLITFIVIQVVAAFAAILAGMVDMKTAEIVGVFPTWLFLSMLTAFPVLGGVLLLCVKYVHRRSPATLLGPGGPLRWGVLLRTCATMFGLLGVMTLLQWLLAPGSLRTSFELRGFLQMLPLVLILVPLQAATEELFFRGWLMQGIGRGGRRVWLAAGINTALFGLAHLRSPFVDGGLGALDYLYFFGGGALLSWVTLRDGRLERAIGLHAGLNLFGFLIVWNELPMVEYPAVFTDRHVTNDPISLAALTAVVAAIWLTRRTVHQPSGAQPSRTAHPVPAITG